jgi:hypothetical protein
MPESPLPEDPAAPVPLVRVVRGHPTTQEMAALVVAILMLGEAESERPAIRRRRSAPTPRSGRWSLQR